MASKTEQMSLINEGYKPTKNNANYNGDTTDRVYYYKSPCSSHTVLKDSRYYSNLISWTQTPTFWVSSGYH